MKIGLFTDGLAHLSFAEALAKAASLGVQAACLPVRGRALNFYRRSSGSSCNWRR
jgi:sugar phosphate isomerase/epimerase